MKIKENYESPKLKSKSLLEMDNTLEPIDKEEKIIKSKSELLEDYSIKFKNIDKKDSNNNSKIAFLDIPNYSDIEKLINMGFRENLVKKVYLFLKPTSIGEAIILIVKDNNLYQHDFYEKESNNLCFICGEEKNFIGITYHPYKTRYTLQSSIVEIQMILLYQRNLTKKKNCKRPSQ